MTLVRYQKPRPRIFNNLFEDFFNDDFYDHVEKINRKALANVMENDNEVTLELLVPGFSKEQITVEVNDNVLTVKGESINRIHALAWRDTSPLRNFYRELGELFREVAKVQFRDAVEVLE